MPKGIHFGADLPKVGLLWFVIMFLPMTLRFFVGRGTIEINNEGITQVTGWGKSSSILWSEIKELAERKSRYVNGLELINERGKTVIFILDTFDQAPQIKARIFEEFKRKGSK